MSSIAATPLRLQVEAQLEEQRRRSGLRYWLTEAAAAIFTFEALYILFILSGMYKNDPRLAWVPGDLTAILLVASVASGVAIILRRGVRVSPQALTLLWLLLAFILWMCLTMLWSPSVYYAQRKALYFPVLTGWSVFAAAFIIAPEERRVRRFFALFMGFALVIIWESVSALIQSYASGNYRALIRAFGSHYGTLGVVIGNGALMLLLYAIYFSRRVASRVVLGVGIFLIVVLLLLLGSRTSLTFPFIAALVPLALNIRWRLPAHPLKLVRTVSLAVIAVLLAATLWSKLMDVIPGGAATIRRFETLGRRGIETEGRFRNLAHGVRISGESTLPQLVFGHGVGSWPILLGSPDEQLYPHNIVVETTVELGLVGLFLLTLIAIHCVRTLGPLHVIRRDRVRVFLLTMGFSFLVVSSVSGDLHENRAFFMFMALMMYGAVADRTQLLSAGTVRPQVAEVRRVTGPV